MYYNGHLMTIEVKAYAHVLLCEDFKCGLSHPGDVNGDTISLFASSEWAELVFTHSHIHTSHFVAPPKKMYGTLDPLT